MPSDAHATTSDAAHHDREGRNRQVRKMCEAIGHPVDHLRRIAIGPLKDTRLKPGQWRDLTDAEVQALRKAASRTLPAQESGNRHRAPDAAARRTADRAPLAVSALTARRPRIDLVVLGSAVGGVDGRRCVSGSSSGSCSSAGVLLDEQTAPRCRALRPCPRPSAGRPGRSARSGSGTPWSSRT